MSLLHRLAQSPFVAALRSLEDLGKALDSEAKNVFFMGGTVTGLFEAVQLAKSRNKGTFVHLDLIRGLSSTDKESLEFVHNYIGADGIITPKSHLIKEAKRVGLYAILHLFVLDSLAMSNGMTLAKTLRPDAIEIMPGLISKVVGLFAEELPDIPIIASGLIQTKEESAAILNVGATSLSVSEKTLWNLSFEDLQD